METVKTKLSTLGSKLLRWGISSVHGPFLPRDASVTPAQHLYMKTVNHMPYTWLVVLERKHFSKMNFISLCCNSTHTLRKSLIYHAGQEKILLLICFLRKYDIICDNIIRHSQISVSLFSFQFFFIRYKTRIIHV